jgi:transketolase N-terminal domain/subunit
MSTLAAQWADQQARNAELLDKSHYLASEIVSSTLPFTIDIANTASLSEQQVTTLQALEIEAARTAISSLATLAKINELDHLGGGLDLISALTLSQAASDHQKITYTIEHAHTSIGYYGVLAARGFIDKQVVIDEFRQGIDIAGHVAWLPGGTQLNGGRLGVMVPAAVGQALGIRAVHGDGSWVLCHCGDAGWISGQALNGFNGADLHNAPITFVMHRNGIQLSGTNKQIMDKDPRPIVEAMGVGIIECTSLHCAESLYAAYREAYAEAQAGRPTMIYPTGTEASLGSFAERLNIVAETEALASANGVDLERKVWIPGALMSYRDVKPMLECIFKVNDLPGGKHHHDGHMQGRSEEEVLSAAPMSFTEAQAEALAALRSSQALTVTTTARPAPGSPNLTLTDAQKNDVSLPAAGAKTSARAGVQEGYAVVAKNHPENVFIVCCDLDASTKLGKARTFIGANQQYEMSIEEQVSAIMANGLACANIDRPALNVFSTFSAFFEGIAREALEMWRYQRNLTGVNEGLNATMHLSHVGACTGRDHFSGWSLDWITLALGYLPYLDRFYAPADARSAYVAVLDLAARYGGHIIGIPRDNLPVLTKQDGSGALYDPDSEWEAVTTYRSYEGADKAILAFGAPAYLAGEAAEQLGSAVDALVVNGLPFGDGELEAIFAKYPGGVVTIEDGIIATPGEGLRGFAGLVAMSANGVPTDHIGIVDPRVAPSHGHDEVWEHFGITTEALVRAVNSL